MPVSCRNCELFGRCIACNIEEPELFNMLCERFFHQVESGRYRMRDPRAKSDQML